MENEIENRFLNKAEAIYICAAAAATPRAIQCSCGRNRWPRV